MRPTRASLHLLPAAVLALGLAGCVDTANQARVDAGAAAPQKIVRRDGVSPRGATMALASVEGAPQPVADAFTSDFAAVAPSLDLTTRDQKTAAYLVRAYISAYPGDQGGTRFSYVLDVFDRRKVRVARITDDVPVKATTADPWQLADVKVVQTLADRSAGDLADALTNTSEAVAGSAVASAAAPARDGSQVAASAAGASVAPPRVAAGAAQAARLGFADAR
ncbi:MAG: hypothetical protein KGM42_10830 [Hyphomicrobiales bacterium]|nr:hypothetical protein [Hyphomicrobiales bacterium]